MVGQDIDNVQLSTALKVLSFVAGIGLIGLGSFRLGAVAFERFMDIMLAIYFIIFGILLMLMELPFPKLLVCFNFLAFYLGKAIFLLFLATLTFGWLWFEILLSIVLFVASICYFVLACTCKDRLFVKDGNGQQGQSAQQPPPANQSGQQLAAQPAAQAPPQRASSGAGVEGAFAPASAPE